TDLDTSCQGFGRIKNKATKTILNPHGFGMALENISYVFRHEYDVRGGGGGGGGWLKTEMKYSGICTSAHTHST
ncbi:hypothetical protein ACJX0J_036942, partial [Zea mays]